MYLVEVVLDRRGDTFRIDRDALTVWAVDRGRRLALDLVRADLKAQRDAFEFPLVEFESRIALVAVVEFDPYARLAEALGEVVGVLEYLLAVVGVPDRHDHDLFGRNGGREDKALVVGVSHD